MSISAWSTTGDACSRWWTREGAVLDIDLERVQQTFNTNVFGAIRVCKAAIPHMAARKSGTIVNIGSIAGDT